MSATEQQIRDLGERWATAEQSGDTATLASLVVDDFTLVGPLGFILDRDQWLHRYESGGLTTEKLVWDEVAVRDYGDTAVAIGRHTQEASFQGNRADAAFRGTHIYLRRDGQWLLAGIHLSPIGAPAFGPRS
ncbi:nuclear transport factor 2 family protein [Fodinicola acaciae]|uniref:nuclear transport factor 2 family protein n=1 Tax=Fodinicola acaciae TaxID=2681555 RepID=UPI0013D1D6E4|nr:nuclear transport factor 2 family protein [Fodinicola acaciae]